MNSIIDDLFFGELKPNYRKCTSKTAMQIADIEAKLPKMLDGEAGNLFIDYTSAHAALLGETSHENFKIGFKLGVRLIAEVLLQDAQ